MNSKTLFYVLKRIGLAILTIWVVITITFFVMHAVPGGPFVGEKATTPAVQAAMEAKYGLDKPVLEQYFTYLGDIVLRFDFGPSLKQRGRQVIDIIADGMKVSAKLGLIAAFGALVVGIVLGAVAALRRNKVIDKVIMVITTAFVSMPSFIAGALLLTIFAVSLHLLPANGAQKNGLILLTDSDAAGFRIRTYITNLVGEKNVVQAYVPAIHGKEKRKEQPGKEGLLGVEGVDDAIVLQALRDALGAEAGAAAARPEGRQITYTDLYEWGLSGRPGSAERKAKLLNALGLPPRLSKKELVEALNRLYTFEQLNELQLKILDS